MIAMGVGDENMAEVFAFECALERLDMRGISGPGSMTATSCVPTI